MHTLLADRKQPVRKTITGRNAHSVGELRQGLDTRWAHKYALVWCGGKITLAVDAAVVLAAAWLVQLDSDPFASCEARGADEPYATSACSDADSCSQL